MICSFYFSFSFSFPLFPSHSLFSHTHDDKVAAEAENFSIEAY